MSYQRRDGDRHLVVILNHPGAARRSGSAYRARSATPFSSDSDAREFGGGFAMRGAIDTEPVPWHGSAIGRWPASRRSVLAPHRRPEPCPHVRGSRSSRTDSASCRATSTPAARPARPPRRPTQRSSRPSATTARPRRQRSARWRRRDRHAPIAPTRVTAGDRALVVTLPPSLAGAAGRAARAPHRDRESDAHGRPSPRAASVARVRRPGLGYHHVALRLHRRGAACDRRQQTPIVAPRRPLPSERLGKRGVFGFLANLRRRRERGSWGGRRPRDLGARRLRGRRRCLVGVNPCASCPQRREISPYSPVSRHLPEPALPRRDRHPRARRDAERAAPRSRATPRAARSRALRAGTRRTAMASDDAPRGSASRLHAPGIAIATAARPAYRRYRRAAFRRFSTRHLRHARSAPRPRLAPLAALSRSGLERGRAISKPARRGRRSRDVDPIRARSPARRGRRARRPRGLAIGVYQDAARLGRAGSDPWAFPGLLRARRCTVSRAPTARARRAELGLPAARSARDPRRRHRCWIRLLRHAFRQRGRSASIVMGRSASSGSPGGPAGEVPTCAFRPMISSASSRSSTRARRAGDRRGISARSLPAFPRGWGGGHPLDRVALFTRTGAALHPAASYPRQPSSAPTHTTWSRSRLDRRPRSHRARTGNCGNAGEPPRGRAAGRWRARAAARRCRLWRARDEPDGGSRFRGALPAMALPHAVGVVVIALDDLAGVADPVNLPGASTSTAIRAGPAGGLHRGLTRDARVAITSRHRHSRAPTTPALTDWRRRRAPSSTRAWRSTALPTSC